MDNLKKNIDKNHEILIKSIKAITHSGLDKLDGVLLTQIKSLCKNDENCIDQSSELLMKHLREKHSEVRLSAFQLCIELFKKSHKFRLLVIRNLEQIVMLCTGIDPEKPLPLPKEAAEKLKKLCLLTVYDWKTQYGESYKQILLCYNYFSTCKNLPFEAVQLEVTSEENVRLERERQVDKARQEILQKVLTDMEAKVPEIENSVKTVKNCISLLLPPPEDFFVVTAEESDDFVNHSSCQELDDNNDFNMRLFGLRTSYNLQIEINPNKKVNVTRNDGNGAIIDNLKDNLILLKKRHTNYIKKWLSDLSKSGNDVDTCNIVNNLNTDLEDCFKKYEQLRVEGIDLIDDDEDDNDFEEVNKEGYEPDVLPIFQAMSSKAGESSKHLNEAGSSNKLAHALNEPEKEHQSSKPIAAVPDWQDPELLARLKEATGIDLKMPEKKKKGQKRKPKKKMTIREQYNFPGITNLRKLKNTTKERLKKKLFNRATLRRMSKNS